LINLCSLPQPRTRERRPLFDGYWLDFVNVLKQS
jgi:hypothetical protein